jgi:hypothetical protein
VPAVLAADAPRASAFDPRFAIDPGRPARTFSAEALSFTAHGEYQVRYRGQTDLSLTPSPLRPAVDRLGQNHVLLHWLRFRPRLSYEGFLSLVGEMDLPRGFVAGDVSREVDAARDPLSQPNFFDFHPRELYLEWYSPVGLFRVGQQAAHFGLGLVDNDGDHRSFFGDFARGTLVERVSYSASPLGSGRPLVLSVAGDLVFEDATTRLLAGELAFMGTAAVGYQTPSFEVVARGSIRHEERTAAAGPSPSDTVKEEGLYGLVGLFGRGHVALVGMGATAYAEGELAVRVGDRVGPAPESVLGFGGVVRAGVAHGATGHRAMLAGKAQQTTFGDWAVEAEVGVASGDANPNDGVDRRFSFEPNHNVGLVLFEHLLAATSARSATLLRDPASTARPPNGTDRLATNGAVAGATYLQLRGVVRPVAWLDCKLGLLVAAASSDVVDPYQARAFGRWANPYGGDPSRRDLGAEIDAGLEVRLGISDGAVLQLGAEGGVLFPGRAFDDEAGHSLDTQAVGVGRVGVQY